MIFAAFVDLFATSTNTMHPLHVPPVPDPLVWNQDAFQHPWNDLIAYIFSSGSCKTGLVESDAFDKSLLGSSCLAS